MEQRLRATDPLEDEIQLQTELWAVNVSCMK
jgi:hypothetical protein